MTSLFSPLTIGDLALPSRIVMAPMTRHRALHGKIPGHLNALHYAQRASAGLVITESTEIDPHSSIDVPTRPGLFNDEQQAGWRLVTGAVHAAGGRIFVQLSHMGRTALPSQLRDDRWPAGPSALAAAGKVYTANGPEPYVEPQALTPAGIAGIVAEFANAAARAKNAGFDGIEIHGANGYLVDQFLRDGSNIRSDGYGGTVENRFRFLREIIGAVKAYWPAGRIGVRVSPTNPFQDMSDSDPVAHFAAIAALLQPLGLAYLHVVAPAIVPEGQADVAPAIRAAFHGPLIVAGGYRREHAEAVLAGGGADLVAFGEAFIANPDLPQRWRSNAPLNAADKSTFYTTDAKGYTDYPSLELVDE
ncbi:alkene reductase [Phyllobacterium myrsinacearum]|uniref:Alkene reductase n=1 Tax=Phyllobacterium myrsinacearum TaxID=28101 RepID=A0A2S9JYW4_9HYPH|nr:alkene reductase [Phyllobacterium myrsinacearum]PRD58534.1 alkene reductase [Phyllobacterium myrsinacearum]PWV96784.1 N-ethylmaleimide reductase [Phyllobacterium myrsinacearum]RZV09223.1 N-ethylmaleimide reductase [Phyllobacterium myrsinacearum]